MIKKVALAGCGGWGKNLARNLHEFGVLQVSVYGGNMEKAVIGPGCTSVPSQKFLVTLAGL